MTANELDYFPSKLAKAPRFCNRHDEINLLNTNIKLSRHTVVVSPRRYGKSSLVRHVVTHLELPYASIDLFLAYDEQTIIKRILDGISVVLWQMMPMNQKAISLIQKHFVNFTLSMQASGIQLQIKHATQSNAATEQIFDSLRALSQLAAERKKKVVIFIDEFQDLAQATHTKAIQGAIRHVAQDTENIVFIFSGSNRDLLLQLFDDKSKPLYMLCDKLFLERIHSQHYIDYIQTAAKAVWKKPLTAIVLERIFSLTELHPFYVNLLGHALLSYKGLPDIQEVMDAWHSCYETESRRIVTEIEKLPKNQQLLLKALANYPNTEPLGQTFLSHTELSTSSAKLALNALLKKDMIEKIKFEDVLIPQYTIGQWRVLDPLLAYALRLLS